MDSGTGTPAIDSQVPVKPKLYWLPICWRLVAQHAAQQAVQEIRNNRSSGV